MTPEAEASAEALLRRLYEIWSQHDEISIRRADLKGRLDGYTRFRDDAMTLADDLDFEDWKVSLGHELEHVEHGPVPGGLAATECAAIEGDVAELLVPDADKLRASRRQWTEDERLEFAARYRVPRATIDTIVSGPPTLPFPAIPAQGDEPAAPPPGQSRPSPYPRR